MSKYGKLLRGLFIANPNRHTQLVVADYSQIEYRLLAWFSQEPALLSAFEAGVDVHSLAAASVLGIQVGSVTKEQRALGKLLRYSSIYGAGARNIAQTMAKTGMPITMADAKDFLYKLAQAEPKVAEWKATVLDDARHYGYVTLPSGRKRRLEYINSSDQNKRAHAERQAINFFPQGTAADILKIATIDLYELGIVPSLTVHDELVIECSVPAVEKGIADNIKVVMEGAAKKLDIDIHIPADVKVGSSWAVKE